jgi:hypothetical protein
LDLTTQHRDLVAKDKNLDLLRPLTTHAQHDRLQQLPQDQVSERQDHAGQPASHRTTDNGQNRSSDPKPSFRAVQVTAGSAHDYDTWEELEEAQRVPAGPERLNSFIAARLSDRARSLISRRLR